MKSDDHRARYLQSIASRLEMRSLEQLRVIDQCISLLDDQSPLLKQLGSRLLHDEQGQSERDIHDRSIWNAAISSAIEVVTVSEARKAERLHAFIDAADFDDELTTEYLRPDQDNTATVVLPVPSSSWTVVDGEVEECK